MALLLPADSAETFAVAVAEAARRLRAGEVVGLPTETVYGLAANAFSAEAVQEIYRVKGRPSSNPLIVHVADEAMVAACVTAFPAGAMALARAFWPGPLTLVLPAKLDRIPAEVRAGGATVAIRWPAHPLMAAVIRAAGVPLAAPSANPSNAISPTTARHVQDGLGARIGLIVDGGPCQVGIESTVVDCTGSAPVILRPGTVSEEEIRAVWGGQPTSSLPQAGFAEADAPLRSPGQLVKHYAPRAPLSILSWTDTPDLHAQLAARGWAPATVHLIAHARVPAATDFHALTVLPPEPRGYARQLYAALHTADAGGAARIVVEAPPAPLAWAGIRDRLGRAASKPGD